MGSQILSNSWITAWASATLAVRMVMGAARNCSTSFGSLAASSSIWVSSALLTALVISSRSAAGTVCQTRPETRAIIGMNTAFICRMTFDTLSKRWFQENSRSASRPSTWPLVMASNTAGVGMGVGAAPSAW